MSSKINLQTCEYARKSSIFQDNQLIYVKPAYRKRGLASEMITFAEAYCSKNYPLDKYELLTGQENLVAQTVYNKLGYVDDNELHLSKQVRK